MADKPQIPEWNGGKLENGEFLNYSKEVARLAHGFDAQKVPLGDRLATLDAANVKLSDFINESRKYGGTAEIAKLDARRDIIFRAIWDYVAVLAELDNTGETIDVAAHRVQAALSPYKGLHRHPLTKETEEISGLKYDLLEKEGNVRDEVTTLGLNGILLELFSVNTALAETYNARTDEGIGRETSKGGLAATPTGKLIAAGIKRMNGRRED